MALFYTYEGEAFIPEAINPELVRLAKAIVKTCRFSVQLQLKTTALNNALKSGDRAAALDLMQKVFEKHRKLYNEEMTLSGVVLDETDDAFFEDKDDAFFRRQLQVLIDFAAISVVIEHRAFPLMSAASQKTLGKPLDKIKFFTNQPKDPGETPQTPEETPAE